MKITTIYFMPGTMLSTGHIIIITFNLVYAHNDPAREVL